MTKPIQVYLERTDLESLEAFATARGWTKSQAIRTVLESLEAFATARGWTKSQAIRTAIRALTRRPPADPVLELSGDIDALPPDLSAEFDRYLNETFVAEPAATYRTRRRNRARRSTVRR